MFTRSTWLGRMGLFVAAGASLGLAGDQDPIVHVPTPSGWRQHDVRRPKPPVVAPGEAPAATPAPADAVVLFDGKSLDAWSSADGGKAAWKVADGGFEVAPGTGAIQTRESFGDVQLHVEWASPNPPNGKGQDRGNSGIFLMGQFELQVLDSYKADTYADGQAGALYGQYPPLFNASRPPGEWQTYDVAFRAPRFDKSGAVREPARMTVFFNGVLVQNNEELTGHTSWLEALPYEKGVDHGPIQLQDHGHPVRFRNIWLRKLPDRPGPSPENRQTPKTIALQPAELDALAGVYAAGTDPHAMRIVMTRQGDHLRFKLPFRPTPLEIVPVSATHFEFPQTDGRFVFQKDAQGHVTGVKLTIGDGGGSLFTKIKP
ncbi:3-keto-disaccharide hydrolase [Paludisphaera borealis]|uniref:3-keto-alpha-glucoside-1,2-lyase/3-keto-2-hydroxy-glucal hydratase domain-containing protein n=1 Tax=Paludisphaera borealis TaxID=1387353 RepID=A0A1U7CSY7_9BACT|nr:DUF1080 domain-containing protein [Paludisphaera borealis]APW62060.1 putative beta-jelly-roll-type glycoside hydrolase of unknown function [Paludisphaera borealis]